MGKSQHEKNLEIEALVKEKGGDRDKYRVHELALVSQYTGAGGQGAQGARGSGLLHEFYTPPYLAQHVWDLARHHGFDESGRVLEPSCGTGRFFEGLPPNAKAVGIETNPVTATIAKVLYPGVEIHNLHFEAAFMAPPRFTSLLRGSETWLDGYPFSLVIGNPPFGKHKNRYSGFFAKPKTIQAEHFFIYHGLRLLEVGGLLAYVAPSSFLRSAQAYNAVKKAIGELATFVDAYRLPSVFGTTTVPVDILMLRRK